MKFTKKEIDAIQISLAQVMLIRRRAMMPVKDLIRVMRKITKQARDLAAKEK